MAWILIGCIVFGHIVGLKAYSAEFQLRNNLFSNYSTSVRPVRHASDVINVTVLLDVVFMEELDERNQRLSAIYWIMLSWRDAFLQWNPEDYENITYLPVLVDALWRPDLVLSNAVVSKGLQNTDGLLAELRHTGHILWYAYETATTTCVIDVTKFPFDTQECPVVLWQWASKAEDVTFTVGQGQISSNTRLLNGKWTIENIVGLAEMPTERTRIRFFVTLKRLEAYYVIAAILPLLLLSCVSLCTFLLPRNSDERLNLAMSILLAYSVYASSLHSMLPEVSSTWSTYSLYVTGMFFMKALILVTHVVILHTRSLPPRVACVREDGGISDEAEVQTNEIMDTAGPVLELNSENRSLHDIRDGPPEVRQPKVTQLEVSRPRCKLCSSEVIQRDACLTSAEVRQDWVLFGVSLALFTVASVSAFTFMATA